MTRINCAIPVEVLTDQHLLAEHREIKRVPKSARTSKSKVPEKFTLGEGHVRFFYNKQKFLLRRYRLLYQECKKRGFEVQDYSGNWENMPETLNHDYIPTDTDFSILKNRLIERIKNSSQIPRFHKKDVGKNHYDGKTYNQMGRG